MVDHLWTSAQVASITLIIVAYLLSLIHAKPECPIGFQLAESEKEGKVCYFLMEEKPFGRRFDDCASNQFSMELYNSLKLTKTYKTFWADYKSAYPGGPFVDWSYTSSMGNRVEDMDKVRRDFEVDINEELCMAIDPVTNLTAVKCSESQHRYCFVKPYSESELITEGCLEATEGDFMFGILQPMCLTKWPVHKNWRNSQSFCTETGSLLGRGWRYSNYYEKNEQYWPLNIKFNDSHQTFLEYAYEDDKSVTNSIPIESMKPIEYANVRLTIFFPSQLLGLKVYQIPSDYWEFSQNLEPNKSLVAIHNNSWSLVSEEYEFTEVICEQPVELKHLSLSLSTHKNSIQLKTNDTLVGDDIFMYIQCYTDSLEYYPRAVSVNTDEPSNPKIDVENDGYYWCSTTADIKAFYDTESNKQLYIRNVDSTDRLYAIKMTVSKYKLNVQSDTIHSWKNCLSTLFESYTDFNFHEIEELQKMVIKRIYLDSKTLLLHAQLRSKMMPFEQNFDMKRMKEDNNICNITYVRPVYSCDKDLNLNLDNKQVTQDCKSYTCIGDYIEGVETIVKEICNTSTTTSSTTEALSTSSTMKPYTNVKPAQKQIEKMDKILKEIEEMLDNKTAELYEIEEKFKNISMLIENRNDNMEIPGRMLRQIEDLGSKIVCDEDDYISTENIALLLAKATSDAPLIGLRIAQSDDETSSKNNLKNKDVVVITDINESKALDKDELLVIFPKSVTETDFTQVTFVVYGKNSVFQNPDVNGTYPISVVVNVKIKNDTKFLEGEVLKIEFASSNETEAYQNRTCAYWQYTENDSGFWSQENCTFKAAANGSLDTCECNHLTHFAQVVISSKLTLTFKDKATLELLTIIGCWISIVGLFMITVTAAQFRSWRLKFTNKVWCQLCVSILLLYVCFLIIVYARFNEHDFLCMLTGVVLHYAVLASCCWMLVVAIVSYRELVVVFNGDSSHKLLKAAAFAWGAPFIIVVLLVSIDRESYVDRNENISPTDGAFCYPSGIARWVSVYSPIAITLITNWTLYALILQSVFISRRVESHCKDSNEALRCASVSCMLAFLFGLPWSFGLFSFNVVMDYLFTILATFQGFILFVFIVVGNKKTRDLWLIKMKLKKQRLFSSAAYTNRSGADVPLRPNRHNGEANRYQF